MTKLIPIDKMGWSEKLAITAGMDLSDTATVKHVSEVLKVTVNDLQANLGLAASGDVEINTTLNPSDYVSLFDTNKIKHREGGVSAKNSAPITKPSSAKKAPKVAAEKKKPGRQGDKILQAFRSINTTPQFVDDFQKKFGISQPVLQQAKRFDKLTDPKSSFYDPSLGKVRVTTDAETKRKVIFRVPLVKA